MLEQARAVSTLFAPFAQRRATLRQAAGVRSAKVDGVRVAVASLLGGTIRLDLELSLDFFTIFSILGLPGALEQALGPGPLLGLLLAKQSHQLYVPGVRGVCEPTDDRRRSSIDVRVDDETREIHRVSRALSDTLSLSPRKSRHSLSESADTRPRGDAPSPQAPSPVCHGRRKFPPKVVGARHAREMRRAQYAATERRALDP